MEYFRPARADTSSTRSHPRRRVRGSRPPIRHLALDGPLPVRPDSVHRARQSDHRLSDFVDPDAVGVTSGAHEHYADQGESERLDRLTGIIRSSSWFMELLRAARDVQPPDWLVGGGVLRDLVWDRLHGFVRPTLPRDVDLAFFDPERLDSGRDLEVERALSTRLPGVRWDAKNQAAVHRWYPRVFGFEVEPLLSTADGVATWPETATAVAVRLEPNDRLLVVAPCGLADLLGLVCRRNPRRVTVEEYRRRVVAKRIAERWPGVRVVGG